MARVIVRPKARREIYGILAYYIGTAGIEVARRFRGFESYLIFYVPRADGIAVERVIHASQDYRHLLK